MSTQRPWLGRSTAELEAERKTAASSRRRRFDRAETAADIERLKLLEQTAPTEPLARAWRNIRRRREQLLAEADNLD